MKVKVKRLHKKAVLPDYANEGDAGLDLIAVSKTQQAGGKVTYGTGLAFEIPAGYVGLLFPRSSIRDRDLSLANSVGVIDSGYRGEVKATFIEHYRDDSITYFIGEKIAQLIIIPYSKIEIEEVSELSKTKRGWGGFGSTGV